MVRIFSPAGLLADPEDRPRRQHGGETLARQALQSFLTSRGEGYAEGISSPLTAWDSCSRLSTYLSWGHISLRVVVQAVQARQVAARYALSRLHAKVAVDYNAHAAGCWQPFRTLMMEDPFGGL